MTISGLLRGARIWLAVLLVLAATAGVIGAAWLEAWRTSAAQTRDAEARGEAVAASLDATYADQIERQILALDQTLAAMASEWESDPRAFDLEKTRQRALILNGISRDMLLADENGIIRQSSVADFVGQRVADLEIFRQAVQTAAARPALLLGAPSVNPIMRQWHLDAARALRNPDGSFAGVIVADYRLSAITEAFRIAAPPGNAFGALIGLADGRLRGIWGPPSIAQEANVSDTPLFAAVEASRSGIWIGPSIGDAARRIHAFRRLRGRELAVVAGLDQQEALQPARDWERAARLFAVTVTGLALVLAVLFLSEIRATRVRGRRAREHAASLAAAHALAEVSRAHADAATQRLRSVFASLTEGIAIFDAHLDLVEWNGLFPDHAGVNASLIRVGLPMEDLLRTQAESGCFGEIADVTQEVERRAAMFRAGSLGEGQGFVTNGRDIEPRCLPLADGGFVVLYADVTNARLARRALRDARAGQEQERQTRMRFLSALTREIRDRVGVLVRAAAQLRGMGLNAEQTPALERLRRGGESLAVLATDVGEISDLESDRMTMRPALTGVGDLLRDVAESLQPAAVDRGLSIYPIVYEDAPPELIADPHRLRQILVLLVHEALRHANAGAIWLMAEAPRSPDPAAEVVIACRLTVRGFGKPVSEEVRAHIFRPLGDIGEAFTTDPAEGTGLGPAVARAVASCIGLALSCETWATLDGRTGNDFVLSLPASLLPDQTGAGYAAGRRVPRTRVLLAGPHTGVRDAAITLLERAGHMVDAPATAEAAVRGLETVPYDIAFLDTALPGASLDAVARAIRALPGPGREVPLIALAASHEPHEAAAWRDAGINAVIASPPNLSDLTTAIARLVWSAAPDAADDTAVAWETEREEGVPILLASRIHELSGNLDAGQLADMAEECIDDLTRRLPALRRALAAGVPGAIVSHAHAMVGMAGGYGMAVLEARLRAILTAVREQRLHTIEGAAEVVEADLKRAAATLRRALAVPQGQGADQSFGQRAGQQADQGLGRNSGRGTGEGAGQGATA